PRSGTATAAAPISRLFAFKSSAYRGRVRFRAGTCLLGAVLALALAAPARALSPTVTEFSTGLSSADDVLDIANGPDGNLWFADAVTGGALGRVSTSGSITKFSAGLSPGG